MIVFIAGKIIGLRPGDRFDSLDILTPNGIAYRVLLPVSNETFALEQEVKLYTSFQVREDSQTLYGFRSAKERDFFEALLGVSGIGPKIAISILSTYSVQEAGELIKAGDYSMLSRVSGLGLKGAKKIIVELQSKLDQVVEIDLSGRGEVGGKVGEVKEALRSLGFKGDELKKQLERAREVVKSDPEVGVEVLLSSVLKSPVSL